MQKLSELSPNIEISLQQATRPSPLLPPGLTSNAGRLTTLPPLPSNQNAAAQELAAQEQNPVGNQKVSEFRPSTQQTHSASDKQRLAEALWRVCALQKQYGKTQAELETLVEGFCWVLAAYPMELVLQGIRQYIQRNSDIPAPADILNIIDPPAPVQERLSGAMYIEIKKKMREGTVFIMPEQREFCRAYEKQETDKVRGGSDELRQANAEIEKYSRQFDESY